MPTINVEMMKQLLQEFTEKEALTGEEIKAIEEQVAELSQRIEICHDKLKNLNEDRERLAAMSTRYTQGQVSSINDIAASNRELGLANLPGLASGSSFSKNRPLNQSAREESKNTEAENKVEQPEPATIAKNKESSTEVELLDHSGKEKEEKVEIEGSVEIQEPAKEKPAESGGGDDAIKSINEALKGLFRK